MSDSTDRPWTLGEVRNHGFDDTGHERRERCEGIAECPKCGKEVPLVADTEAWIQRWDGRWQHSEYAGCAHGVCCGLLIVDGFDGCDVWRLIGKSDVEV